MSIDNMLKMRRSENKNVRLFAETVYSFSKSQGMYGRVQDNINKMNYQSFNKFVEMLSELDFKDTLDVVLWLET